MREDPPDSTCPVEQHLVELMQVKLDSLQGLTLSGLEYMTPTYLGSGITGKTNFDAAFNYRALKMVRLVGEIPEHYTGYILKRLMTSGSIEALSFNELAMESASEIPAAMRPNIISLDIAGAEILGPDFLLSFSSLQSLSCKVADVKHPSHLSHRQLDKLTLIDNIQAISKWTKDYLSHPNYMPKLRSLHIIVEWTSTLADERKALVIELPESRNITMQVEYKSQDGW